MLEFNIGRQLTSSDITPLVRPLLHAHRVATSPEIIPILAQIVKLSVKGHLYYCNTSKAFWSFGENYIWKKIYHIPSRGQRYNHQDIWVSIRYSQIFASNIDRMLHRMLKGTTIRSILLLPMLLDHRMNFMNLF